MDYWFKAKKYGWGWYPATREGWLVTIAYLAFIIWWASTANPAEWDYYVVLALAVFTLIAMCYKTGEKPSWHWGK